MFTAVLVLSYALFAQLDRYSEPAALKSANTIQQSPPIAAPQSSAGPVENTPPVNSPRTNQAVGAPLLGGGPATVTHPAAATPTPPGLNDRSLNQLPFAPPPVSGVVPLGPPQAIKVTPSAVVRSILQSPSAAQLPGQKVTLAEVLGTTSSRQEQTERVVLYWELSSTVADHYLALREQQDLQGCSHITTGGSEVWQAANDRLNVRVESTRLAAMATQLRFASELGRPSTAALPLPGDLPHCGNYQPHYQEIFAGRKSTEAEQLKELLPLRYAEMKLAAARVAEMQDLLAMTIASIGPGSGVREAQVVVDAMSLLSLERRAFLQIAKDYNQRIVCYAMLAKPQPLETSRLVAMLIKRPTGEPAAGSPVPNHLQSSDPRKGNGRETFADGQQWQPQNRPGTRVDAAVVPASGESLQTFRPEKSVLVTPDTL